MSKLRDKLFIWGQDPGTHHVSNVWNLPGVNKMTPAEGCAHLGISGCARVVMRNKPAPPYDNEMEKLAGLNVIWSIVGDISSNRTDTPYGELDEVLHLAEKYPNLIGGILDDFFNVSRMQLGIFTPAHIAEMGKRLHEAHHPLDLYGVVYAGEITEQPSVIVPYLTQMDVLTFWTWYGEELKDLDKNMTWLQEHIPGKRYSLGLYLWDYGNARPYTKEQMEYQLSTATKWLLEKRIDSAFICSNCIMDVGIEAADLVKDWIARVGDLEIPD